MNAQAEPSTFQEALDQFMHLFYDERTAPLNEETIARYTRKRTTVSSKRIRNSCSWRCGWMRKNGYLRTRNRRKKPPTPQQIPQPKRRRQSFPDSRNRKPSKHSWRPSRKATTGHVGDGHRARQDVSGRILRAEFQAGAFCCPPGRDFAVGGAFLPPNHAGADERVLHRNGEKRGCGACFLLQFSPWA